MIVRQVPWTEQPQDAVGVDWGNPLSQRLVYATSGIRSSDNIYAGGVGVRNTPFGQASTFISGASIETPLKSHATQRTYFVLALKTESTLGRIFDKRVSGAQVEILYAPVGLYYERLYSGGNVVFNGPDPGLNTPFSAVVRYDTATPSSCIFTLNGVTSTATGSGGGGASTDTADAYVIGNRKNDGGRPWPGWIGPVFIWDRILSDLEVASITANPWQLFAPRVIRVPVAAAGGGALPTLSNATFVPGSVTATSFRPRVTATY